MRPFEELAESGLLWLINSTTFHPRGYALAIHADEEGRAVGWSIAGDGTEAWAFDHDIIDRKFVAAEETLHDAPTRFDASEARME